MPTFEYPLSAPTASGNNITVDLMLNQPTRITRYLSDLTLRGFWADKVFTPGGGVSGQLEELALLLLRSVRGARKRNYGAVKAYLASQLLLGEVPNQPGLPLEAVASALGRATRGLVVDNDLVTLSTRKSPRVVAAASRSVTGELSRLAQEPARETVKTVAEETDGIGWARMLTGPTSCSFCAMLASRGPVYNSRESALGRGGNPLNLYHTAHLNKNGKLVGGDCDCIAVLVVDYDTWEGRKAFEQLETLWLDTGAKASNAEARNAFRREWDKQVRSGETGDYIAESMKR